MWANLTRSLRRARSVSLPSDHDAAVKMLLPMVLANMHRSLAELLENSNFDINYKYGVVRRTLLHIAANTGYPESLIVLLKKDADPNIQDIAGHTALHIAARNGFNVCVEKLIEYGGDPNICGNDGANVLHWASINGRIEVLNTVLNQIKDIDAEDGHGNTALHSSGRNGHVKVMKALVNAGANVNHLNKSSQSPLHTACSTGQRNSVSFLLTLNPLIGTDAENFTPLSLCLQGGYGVAATLLLEKFSEEPSFEAIISAFVECAIYRSELKTKNITRCLTSIESGRIVNLITEKVCRISCDLGLQVQSTTSDLETLKQLLFKSIEIIKQFLKPKQIRLDSSGNSVPIPSKKCLSVFVSLWKSVDDWFSLFHSNTLDNTNVPLVKNHEILAVMSERLSVLVSALYTISDLSDDFRTFSFSDFISRNIQTLKIIVNNEPVIIFNYFSFLLDNQHLMEPFLPTIKSQPLDKRYKWFYDHLKEVKSSADKILPLLINRSEIFSDSCKKIEEINPQTLLSGINIKFQDEEGMGEGVTREWFNVLLAEIVNPEYGLFSQSADGCTFQPSSQSAVNPDHITYFRFAGHILGLAMFNRHLVDVRFTRSFYKHLLGIKVNYDDVASIDSEYAKNLQWILDNDISELGLALTFLVETDVFGKMEEIELKPNGSQLSVTESNKDEYVQLVTELRMTGAIKAQIDGFLSGFHEIIPAKYLQLFTEDELDYLLAGSSQISVDQWKNLTNYYGDFDENHKLVKWFWQCIDDMDNSQRSSILHFASGRSRIPPESFTYHSFTFALMPSGTSADQLPTASTCMNMLKLPPYESLEVLKDSLMTVIDCGRFGYAFS